MGLRPPARFLAAACCLAGSAALAVAQPAPRTPRRVAEVTLRVVPTTVTYRGRPVVVRYPEDPEVRALGGSAGPILEVIITPPGSAPPVVFETQGIGLALVDSASDWPAFEVWSSAGGGTYTRAVYTWRSRERRYCADRVDDFEIRGNGAASRGTVAPIGLDQLVRFTRSRTGATC